MSLFFKKLIHHWKILLGDRTYLISLFVGIVVFIFSIFVTQVVGTYKDLVHFPSVGDSLLNLLPFYDLDFLFIWGFYFVVFLIILYPLFLKPERGPFVLKTFGILLLVRACFNLLTDIGPPTNFQFESIIMNNPLSDFTFRNDLFFSGHTAVPFLAFLIFRDTYFRWFMLFASVVLATTVLLMHIHYSIDVFAAPFIAHGVYVLSDNVFNKLNTRFSRIIKRYGWKSLQRELKYLKNKIVNK